jgi:hypothetical protein
MKKPLICLLLFVQGFYFLTGYAQEKNNVETLFGQSSSKLEIKKLGYFIAPSFSFTQMDGSMASLFNLRGGVNLNEKFALGAYYNVSMNQIRPKSETIPNIYMDYWSTGAFLEYTLLSSKLVHLTFPLFIGFGEVQMDNEEGAANLGEANFFKIEPSAMLEINLNKFSRLNLGLGYRMIENMNYRNFSHSDISGLTGTIGLKLGKF